MTTQQASETKDTKAAEGKGANKPAANGGAPPNAPPSKPRKRQRVESMMAAPWKPEAIGDCIEGVYQGTEIVPGKGKRRAFPSYHIMTPDGERVRVASAMLNTKLNQIPKGTYVWLTYKGMYKTQNGDSPDYDVDCEEGTELIDPLRGDGSIDEERVDH